MVGGGLPIDLLVQGPGTLPLPSRLNLALRLVVKSLPVAHNIGLITQFYMQHSSSTFNPLKYSNLQTLRSVYEMNDGDLRLMHSNSRPILRHA